MTLTSSDTPETFQKVTITLKQQILSLLLAALWIIAYFSTFERIVFTWFESTTFEHAVLIAPIALWLGYRKRFAFSLARRKKQDAFLGLTGLLFTVLVYVIGKLSLINALQQFALMSMPLFLIWGVFGFVTLRHLLFPLCFFILSVPFGEFLIPQLQEVTADLTVVMLNLSGVPVYREGWYLQIPEGLFHVAEACSGIRFLYSTVTIGLLIAHLEIRSRLKQFVFLVCVLIIPIVANGMRAFIMVYIGHVSNMEAAVGFDHLVYGWVFFLFVTALVIMFSKLFYDQKELPKVGDEEFKLQIPKKRLFIGVVIIGLGPVFMSAFSSYQASALSSANTQDTKSNSITPFFDWEPVYSDYDLYKSSQVVIEGQPVILHEIVYLTEGDEKELLTWSNRPYDPEKWSVAKSETGVHRIDDKKLYYRYLELKDGMGRSVNVVYMWKVSGQFTSKPLAVKSLQLFSKLTLDDFGGIALYAATTGDVPKERLVEALVQLQQQKSE